MTIKCNVLFMQLSELPSSNQNIQRNEGASMGDDLHRQINQQLKRLYIW